MIILTGKISVLKNIIALVLANSSAKDRTISSWQVLPAKYRKFLNGHAPVKCDEEQVTPAMSQTPERLLELTHLFGGSGELDDLSQGTVIEGEVPIPKELITKKLREAISWLRTNSRDHHELFNLVVTDLVIASSKRARAGSTSSAPGCIWIADVSKYETWEVAEILVHELVHNLIFLDELQHRHYDYALISRPENQARSSILKILRPVDKVFHSIIVATELLLYRRQQLAPTSPHRVHPPTPILLRQLKDSIDSLRALLDRSPALLTPRAHALMDHCNRSLETSLKLAHC